MNTIHNENFTTCKSLTEISFAKNGNTLKISIYPYGYDKALFKCFFTAYDAQCVISCF